MTGEIWLGDLVRALHDIQPRTMDEARAIARLLGLAALVEDTGEPAIIDKAVGLSADQATEPGAEDVAGATEGIEVPDVTASPDSGDSDLPPLEFVGRRPIRPTGWGVRVLPRPGTGPAAKPRDRAPLLPPRGSAAIVQALAARRVLEGPLDVSAIVGALARRQVPETLPRQARPTLRFGVEVLVDRGAPMRPFTGDQAQVVAQVRDVVGADLTRVRYFADLPARGAGGGPRPTWKPYAPPERGTRVLVLSDFGLGGPPSYPHRAAPDEWRAFVDGLRRQGCDTVGLVPVAADRWPSWLSSLLPLVCWDRTATVGHATAAVKIATKGR